MAAAVALIALALYPASASAASRPSVHARFPAGGVGARPAALGGAARRAQAGSYGGGWPTEHHDSRNSGETANVGPVASGECASSFFAGRINDTIAFLSSGVSAFSYDDPSDFANAHIFGGSDAVFRIVNKVAGNVSEWACPLAALRGAAPKPVATADFGLVASPVAWAEPEDSIDRVAFAAADGFVYAVDWQGCAANRSVCEFNTFVVPVKAAGAAAEAPAAGAAEAPAAALEVAAPTAARAARARRASRIRLQGVTSCLLWKFASPRGFPFLSPPRHVTAPHPLSPTGMLLVADTAPGNVNVGGSLYALHPTTGALLWNYTVRDGAGASWGLVGISPAWDGTSNGAIYVPAGAGVVALNPATGKVVGAWAGAVAPVVASPTIGEQGTDGGGAADLYVHTQTGRVHRLYIRGNASAVRISEVWYCDYDTRVTNSGMNNALCNYTYVAAEEGAGAEPARRLATAAAAAAPVVMLTPARGGAAVATRAADAAVPGGWNQATTRAARDALAAAVRARFAAAFPGAPSPATPAALAGFEGDADAVAREDIETALMAAALPPASAAALAAGGDWAAAAPDAFVAGYAMLDGAGRTDRVSADAAAYVSDYPYATPTLLNNGGQLAIAQYSAPAGAKKALFLVKASDGLPLWNFTGTTIVLVLNGTVINTPIPWGTSRSSPAVDGNGNLFGAPRPPPNARAHARCVAAAYPPPPPPLPLSRGRRDLVRRLDPPAPLFLHAGGRDVVCARIHGLAGPQHARPGGARVARRARGRARGGGDVHGDERGRDGLFRGRRVPRRPELLLGGLFGRVLRPGRLQLRARPVRLLEAERVLSGRRRLVRRHVQPARQVHRDGPARARGLGVVRVRRGLERRDVRRRRLARARVPLDARGPRGRRRAHRRRRRGRRFLALPHGEARRGRHRRRNAPVGLRAARRGRGAHLSQLKQLWNGGGRGQSVQELGVLIIVGRRQAPPRLPTDARRI